MYKYSRPTPPSITTRPSHAGYLTISSPLVSPAHGESQAGNPSSIADATRPAMGATDIDSAVVPSSLSIPSKPTIASPSATGTRQSNQTDDVSLAGKPADSNAVVNRSSRADDGRSRGGRSTSPVAGPNLSTPSSPRRAAQDPGLSVEKSRVVTVVRDGPNAPMTPISSPLAASWTTTVTPPTPTDRHQDNPTFSTSNQSILNDNPRQASTDRSAPRAAQMLPSHRRVRSASASTNGPADHISRHISPPLTSTVEETRSTASTPGVSPGRSGQAGFFSSVLSAAQSAASTFSSSITNTPLTGGNRNGAVGPSADDHHKKIRADHATATGRGTDRDNQPGASAEKSEESEESSQVPSRSLAVETLGMGNLTLSHLGISAEPSVEAAGSPPPPPPAADWTGPMSSKEHGDRAGTDVRYGGGGGTTEARRVSKHVGDHVSSVVDPLPATSRARAATDHSESVTSTTDGDGVSVLAGAVPIVEDGVAAGARTRPRSMQSAPEKGPILHGPTEETELDLKRAASIRTRVDQTFRRRREGSSATGTTMTTATGPNATVTSPTTAGIVPRLTGFAVASKKRNRDFHQLFRSVPEDDFLIEDYSAAIQKDILLHGRLYVSEGHICFNSNIFGYVTTLVIAFDEVVSVEKKNTAMVFPNAIVVQTLHARNVFASLASRDSTYDLIIGIWKVSHPNLRNSANGVQLDETTTGDPTAKVETTLSEGQDEDDSDEEDDDGDVYDEDADDGGEDLGGAEGSRAESDFGDGSAKSAAAAALRRTSPVGQATRMPIADGQIPAGDSKADRGTPAGGVPTSVQDFPGPVTHGPTECGDQDRHFDRVIRDEVVAAPLGQVYSLLFGPNSSTFMSNWLHDEQKVLDLVMEDDKIGLTESRRARTYSYIKPITAPIGPKQTKCIITETLESLDLEKAVSVTVVTQTPDVPSGNVFSVRTKYCLTWTEGNATRLFTNCIIDWTGKSWLKGESRRRKIRSTIWSLAIPKPKKIKKTTSDLLVTEYRTD